MSAHISPDEPPGPPAVPLAAQFGLSALAGGLVGLVATSLGARPRTTLIVMAALGGAGLLFLPTPTQAAAVAANVAGVAGGIKLAGGRL